MTNSNVKRLLAALVILALGPAAIAYGKMAPPDPIPLRVARADAVVAGKVTKIEDKTVKINEQEYQVAVVKVDTAVRGADGITHVRVAFAPGRRLPGLMADQQVMLFLHQAKGEPFYVIQTFYDVVDGKNPNFEKEVKEATAAAKLLVKPDESLQSKDAKERYLTAAMLLSAYRTPREGQTKQVAIDAKQSQRILEVLAEQDPKAVPPEMYRMNPVSLFGSLGVTDKDGFQPKPGENYEAAVRTWLKDNAAKYRIQKFTAEK